MRAGCKLTCIKSTLYNTCFIKTCFISDELLGGQFLFETLRISLTVKSGENVAKSKCFKNSCDGDRYFFRTEKWIQGFLCKNINILLTN